MAGKKMMKAAPKAKEDLSDFGKLETWLLIIIGAFGLVQSLSILPLPSYFPFAGALLVFVIGFTKLIKASG
jgi:hypothetical protein